MMGKPYTHKRDTRISMDWKEKDVNHIIIPLIVSHLRAPAVRIFYFNEKSNIHVYKMANGRWCRYKPVRGGELIMIHETFRTRHEAMSGVRNRKAKVKS
jgi:hypothetical protein